MQREQQFKEFLGTCGALNAYVAACSDNEKSIPEILQGNAPVDWINSAFNFKNSRKGEQFWESFNKTWVKYLGILEDEDRK